MKLLVDEPPGNGATHAAANGQAEAQQVPVAKTAGATNAAPEKNAVPPKTTGTRPANGTASKRTTRPPKFPYAPQAQLDSEVARLMQL